MMSDDPAATRARLRKAAEILNLVAEGYPADEARRILRMQAGHYDRVAETAIAALRRLPPGSTRHMAGR